MMAKEWTGAAAKDFESKRTIPDKPRNILLAVGIALGLLNILGPMKLFPVCATPPAPISGAAAPVAPLRQPRPASQRLHLEHGC